ncbi:Rz1-like lysis system protein LysC [Enterobacter cloacae]|uniref:Rz1-like lysis system protein LysC n=1 Tax=Enterobacter cloacae TaxID=550 RepID=UPI003C6CAD85
MLLTACAGQQKPQVEYQVIKQPTVSLPADLTSQIDVPQPPASMTFGASVELNAQLYGVIGQCNIDRAAIRRIEEGRQHEK